MSSVTTSKRCSDHCSFDTHCGPRNIFTIPIGIIAATPAVVGESWRSGNWFSRVVLFLTIGFVLFMIYGSIAEKTTGLMERVLTAVFSLILGPLMIALLLWIILHVLMVLTAVIGAVLSGIVVVIATFGGAWEIGKHLIEALKKTDHLEDKSLPFFKKVLGLKAATPPPPPASVPPSGA